MPKKTYYENYRALFQDDNSKKYSLEKYQSTRKRQTDEKAQLLIETLLLCNKNETKLIKENVNIHRSTKEVGYIIEPTSEQLQLIHELIEIVNNNSK